VRDLIRDVVVAGLVSFALLMGAQALANALLR